MLYEFRRHSDGATVEQWFPVEQRPHIGETVTIDGEPCTRIASSVQGNVAGGIDGHPRVSQSLPPWVPGCRHDKTGQPIIESRRHENEVLARTGYVRDEG